MDETAEQTSTADDAVADVDETFEGVESHENQAPETTETTVDEVVDSTEEVIEDAVAEIDTEVAEEAITEAADAADEVDDQIAAQIDAAIEETLDSGIQVNAAIDTNGGDISIDAGETGTLLVSSSIDASNTNTGAVGGDITLLGENVGLLEGADVDASGDAGGGTILIGGERQGGGDTETSEFVYLDENAAVTADGGSSGDGGTVILFAENSARIHGSVSARGGTESGDGGFIETSGVRGFEISETPDVSASNGQGGEWLIDPSNVLITSGVSDVVNDGFGIFSPVADDAILSVATLISALDAGDVTLLTTNVSGTQSGIVTIDSDIVSNTTNRFSISQGDG